MKVLNFGSLNVDHVYRVRRIAQPGETVPSVSCQTFAGGKGANQSIALARAGAEVWHAGKVGPESAWLRDKLSGEGVNVDFVTVAGDPGGHAIIQVDDMGQNSIVLYGGTNQDITPDEVARALNACAANDLLLLQNEINCTADLIRAGNQRGLAVCFNPAPMTDAVLEFPLQLVDVFFVNDHEGAALSGETDPQTIVTELGARFPGAVIVLTLGSDGVLCLVEGETTAVSARKVKAVDTTAAARSKAKRAAPSRASTASTAPRR